jgi:hypothetical protein
MNTFQIVIKNKYGADKRFLLLQAIPSPTNGPSGDVFTNVYQRSPKIQSGESSVQFAMQQEYFAIIGTASKSDDGTHRVYTNSSLPIKLGPGGTIATVTTQDNDPMWDVNVTAGKTTAIKGGFAIVTDNSFTTDNPSKSFQTLSQVERFVLSCQIHFMLVQEPVIPLPLTVLSPCRLGSLSRGSTLKCTPSLSTTSARASISQEW